MNMNYEEMSTPQSTLCSKTACFNVELLLIGCICFCYYPEGYWLQPSVLNILWGRLPTSILSLGFPWCPMCSFCFRTENSLYSNSLRPLWFITLSFQGPFKCLVFLCFPIICAPPSFNPHFSQGAHSGNSYSQKSWALCRKREKTGMMYAKNNTRQLCVAKW